MSKIHQITVEYDKEKYIVNIAAVTENFEEALSTAEVMIICVQTNYHKELIQRISKYLHDGQTIIIEPGYLSTCYFMQKVSCNVTIIEAENLRIDCRIGD